MLAICCYQYILLIAKNANLADILHSKVGVTTMILMIYLLYVKLNVRVILHFQKHIVSSRLESIH